MPNRLDFAKILKDELDKKEQKNDNAIINTSNIKQNEIRGDREIDRGTPNSYIGELGRGSTLASIRYGDSGSKSKQQRSFENNQRGDSEESRSTAMGEGSKEMGEGSKRVSRFDGSQIWRYNLKEAERLIANILVRNNYEDSLESAISKNAIPAYREIDNKYLPRRKILYTELQKEENYLKQREELLTQQKEREIRVKELFKSVLDRAENFRKMLNDLEPKAISLTKQTRFEKIRLIKSKSTDELIQSFRRRRR
ncbi:MAG: hypothetical protein K2P17_02495 [Helicobacteraceae bacterium]|nr:hypothetical protein [Helicobacteraceae bacterium]